MLLQKIEWLRKGAFEMMEEAKVMAEEAAKASFQYPDTKMLVEARELQDDADKQLSEALCMEKLLHGRCAKHVLNAYCACIAILLLCHACGLCISM